MIAGHARPLVAPMYRLQFEPARDTWVLLYPDGIVQLNTPAAEILRRCNGERTVDDIVGELERAFARTALADDVNAFLEQAQASGWLCPNPLHPAS